MNYKTVTYKDTVITPELQVNNNKCCCKIVHTTGIEERGTDCRCMRSWHGNSVTLWLLTRTSVAFLLTAIVWLLLPVWRWHSNSFQALQTVPLQLLWGDTPTVRQRMRGCDHVFSRARTTRSPRQIWLLRRKIQQPLVRLYLLISSSTVWFCVPNTCTRSL